MVGRSALAKDVAHQPTDTASPHPTLKAGVHQITAEAYHADPAPKPSLSASIAKVVIEQSPRHAWMQHPRLNPKFVPAEDPKFDIGRAAHALMLEGAARFELIDAKDWRSEAARDERRVVREAGHIPLLESEWAQVSAMVKAAREQLRETDAHQAFRKSFGQAEQTIIWQEGAVWCRIRPDWLQNQRGNRVMYDYKTTGASAEPSSWSGRTMLEIGSDIQSELYRLGARRQFGKEFRFKFIVQETQPPFALSVIELSPMLADLAQARVKRAIAAWAWCQKRDRWPGYSSRTYFAEPAGWYARNEEAQQLQASIDRDQRVDPFKLSISLWKP